MGSLADHQNPVDSQEEEAFLFARNIASGAVLPMVIKSAIELGLLDNIAKAGPGAYVSPSHLAAQLPNHNSDAPEMVDRILRLLTSYSLLNSTSNILPDGGGVETLYALAPLSKFLVKNADGMSLAPLLLFNLDKVFVNSWYHFNDAVLEGGIPFEKAYGMSAFEYNGTDPRINKLFNQAMSNHSTMTMKKIIDMYDGFQGLTTIVDVGGGIGGSLKMIISKYPSIKGINFDLPHVVQDATPFPGIEFVGGNMFENVPTGDVIFMKWIWHDWGDEHCLKFLKNCYEALPAEGKMIVAESILPDPIDTKLATKNILCVDLNMMAYNPGGKERTEKELEALGKRAGFTRFTKICCAFNTWIMEFHK